MHEGEKKSNRQEGVPPWGESPKKAKRLPPFVLKCCCCFLVFNNDYMQRFVCPMEHLCVEEMRFSARFVKIARYLARYVGKFQFRSNVKIFTIVNIFRYACSRDIKTRVSYVKRAIF